MSEIKSLKWNKTKERKQWTESDFTFFPSQRRNRKKRIKKKTVQQGVKWMFAQISVECRQSLWRMKTSFGFDWKGFLAIHFFPNFFFPFSFLFLLLLHHHLSLAKQKQEKMFYCFYLPCKRNARTIKHGLAPRWKIADGNRPHQFELISFFVSIFFLATTFCFSLSFSTVHFHGCCQCWTKTISNKKINKKKRESATPKFVVRWHHHFILFLLPSEHMRFSCAYKLKYYFQFLRCCCAKSWWQIPSTVDNNMCVQRSVHSVHSSARIS